MRVRASLLALLSTTMLVGCPANESGNGGTKKDMSTGSVDQGGGGDDDLAATPDLRRPRDMTGNEDDLATNPDEDLAANDVDMTGGSNDDLTGVTQDLTGVVQDLTTDPNTDLTGVAPPDLLTSTDLLVLADMTPTGTSDMTPACTEVGTHDVKTVTISGEAFAATGTSTYKLPLGFAVDGDATIASAAALLPSFTGGRVSLIDAFTGTRYVAPVTTATAVAAGSDLKYSFEDLVAPAGTYYVQSVFFFAFADGTQMADYRTEPDPIVICGDPPARLALAHPVLPALQARRIDVTGLAGAYNTPTIDPDGDVEGTRLFHATLYLESLDGRLIFAHSDSGYVDSASKNAFKFDTYTLPNAGAGFAVKTTMVPRLLSTDVNGWEHTFRFNGTQTITAYVGNNPNAFASLAISASDIVTIAGNINDPNERLFKIWNGFDPGAGDYAYVHHQANCHVRAAADDIFFPEQNHGDIYTDIPNHSFPVKKGEDCDFFGGFLIRVPLSTNAGALPSAPAQYSNVSSNDILVLLTPSELLPVDANTTKNITIPNLSGGVARTIRAQTAGGANIVGASVDVESTTLTNFDTYTARANAVTNGSGQVLLNVLPGTYFVTITAP